jgi:hypothetical protein
MSLLIEENILRLQIPINNIQAMQVFQSKDQLGRIKPTFLLMEIDFFDQVMTHVLAATEIQAQIDVVWGLKGEVQRNYEGVRDLL